MNPLNILMLGGARRVSVGKMFLQAAKTEGYDARLFSYELDEHVPISTIAKVIVGKRWDSPELYSHLSEIVERYHIDIVVPFVDGAVAVAARLVKFRQRLWAPVSDSKLATRMFDKAAAEVMFRDLGLPVPEPFNPANPKFPAIAKPRFGSASKGLRVLRTIKEYNALPNPGDYVIQRYVEHAAEYSVDCYVTHDGKIVGAVPRRRLDVIGGEVVRTATVDVPDVAALAIKTLQLTKLTGAVTVQFIRDEDTGEVMLMEVNPRLGGGVVCSVHAGADIPRAMIREWTGQPCPPIEWSYGIEIVRYLQEIVYRN